MLNTTAKDGAAPWNMEDPKEEGTKRGEELDEKENGEEEASFFFFCMYMIAFVELPGSNSS